MHQVDVPFGKVETPSMCSNGARYQSSEYDLKTNKKLRMAEVLSLFKFRPRKRHEVSFCGGLHISLFEPRSPHIRPCTHKPTHVPSLLTWTWPLGAVDSRILGPSGSKQRANLGMSFHPPTNPMKPTQPCDLEWDQKDPWWTSEFGDSCPTTFEVVPTLKIRSYLYLAVLPGF